MIFLVCLYQPCEQKRRYKSLVVREGEGEGGGGGVAVAAAAVVVVVGLARTACWLNAGLVIERLQVRIPARAAGEISSPKLTLCADSYSMSVSPRVTAVARKRPRSFCQKCRSQVTPKHAHTLDSKKSEWAVFVQT